MKLHKEALIIANSNLTLVVRFNKLIALSVKTEDTQLSRHLKYLAGFYNVGKMFFDERQALQAKITLCNYCNDVILQNKPEWQILAEKNGWAKLPGKE